MNDRKLAKLRSLGLSESDFKPKAKTDAERIADLEASKKDDATRIAELEAQNEMLTECIMELADIIYA